jgi:hypothetical protein
MENSNHTIKELTEYLAYSTRIASFKSNSDYIPFLSSYLIRLNGDISQSFSKHFKEDISLITKPTDIIKIKNNYLSYFEFLKDKKNNLGYATGSDILKLIKDEAEEFIKSAPDYKWIKIESDDTNISMSTVGNVYATIVNENYLIIDFGYSD